MASSNVIGGNQISPSQVSNLSGSISGATAGTVTYQQMQLGTIKVMVLYFNGYENDTTTNDTITFPIAHANAPTVIPGGSTLPSMTASATVLTITSPDSTTTYTGTATVIGS